MSETRAGIGVAVGRLGTMCSACHRIVPGDNGGSDTCFECAVTRAGADFNQRERARYRKENPQPDSLEALAKEYGWRGAEDDLTLRGFLRRALESQRALDVVRQQQVQQTIMQELADAPRQRNAERCRFSVEGVGACVRAPGHRGAHEFANGSAAYRCPARGADFKGIHEKGRCRHALGHDGDHDFAEAS